MMVLVHGFCWIAAEVPKLMEQADKDGNGEIDFDEFAVRCVTLLRISCQLNLGRPMLISLLLQAWFTPKCKEIQEFQHKQELRKKQRRAQKAVRTGSTQHDQSTQHYRTL